MGPELAPHPRSEGRNEVTGNQECRHVEQIYEHFVPEVLYLHSELNRKMKYLSERVDLRYWYPEEPPVPS